MHDELAVIPALAVCHLDCEVIRADIAFRGLIGFQGDRLVGVLPYAAGARQITVTFDSSFSSCTASVIEGHSSGGIIRRKGPNGIMYEISGATTSSPSCSIQSGNAFAG